MPSDHAILNGRVMPLATATVHVMDLGFLRGLGAFETLRTYGGLPHAAGRHLARLWRTAATFGLAPVFTEQTLRRLLRQAMEAGGMQDARINLVVSPGINTGGVFDAESPTWVVIVRNLDPPAISDYEKGIAAITFDADRPMPDFKTTNYLIGRNGLAEARRAGAKEALYVNSAGRVTEGVTSNVEVVRGKVVRTPGADCLPGITREGLAKAAQELGLTWEEGPLVRDDLYRADELWISSSVRELLPVVAVDGRPVGDGKVGPWARAVGARFHQLCLSEAQCEAEQCEGWA